MKKILFIILSFVYFIPLVANAKDISGSVNFENAYRGTSCSNCINLFEETYNKTNFINLLYAQGIRIGDYLNSTLSINDSNFFNSSRVFMILYFLIFVENIIYLFLLLVILIMLKIFIIIVKK